MWERIDNAFRASAAGRWVAALEPNQRSLVTLMALFLAVVVLYLGIWQPLSHWGNRADARYQHQMALLDWMHLQEDAARIAGQRNEGAPESGSLLTLVANSAARAGLQLLRYQPEGSGGVSVVLQNQSFNALINWLAELQLRDHIVVKQISIDEQSEPGMINARINLI